MKIGDLAHITYDNECCTGWINACKNGVIVKINGHELTNVKGLIRYFIPIKEKIKIKVGDLI